MNESSSLFFYFFILKIRSVLMIKKFDFDLYKQIKFVFLYA